jgi:hypothetical protein
VTVRIDALSDELVPQQPITWQKLDVNTLQFNQVGAFTLVLPATPRNWLLVTFDSQGEFIPRALFVDWNGVFQVPLLAEQWEHDLVVDPNTGIITETITLSGADFLCLLANRVAYIDGTKTWANQPTTPRVISGPAETVIKTLVTENMVTAGDTARNVPNFTVATDQGRGGTISLTLTAPLATGSSNWLSGDSAGFDGSLGNWTAQANCGIARTTDRAHSGGHSMQMTSAAAGDMTAFSGAPGSVAAQGMSVRPGDSINCSAWFRTFNFAQTCDTGASFYDISGSHLATIYAQGAVDSDSGWTQSTGSVAAPDNSVWALAAVKVQNTQNAGEVHYVDDVMLYDSGGGATGTYVSNLGQTLMDKIRTVASKSLIGVSIGLAGGNLVFDCYLPRDLSKKAVFSTTLGNLRGDSIADAIPTTDVVLIEDGAQPPNFTEHDSSGDAAGDPWRRTELFEDQTSSTNADDISTAVDQDLADGASAHTLTITATDIPHLRFGETVGVVQGYQLGDTVTIQIHPGISYTDVISAVELTAGSDTSGTVYMGPTTGVQVTGSYGSYYEVVTPTVGASSDDSTADRSAVRRLASQVRKINKAIRAARKAGQ